MVDDEIMGKTIEPGREGRAAWLVAIDRLPRLEEYLLGQILRFARRAHPIEDVAINTIEVLLVETAEGDRIPLHGPADELVLVWRRRRPFDVFGHRPFHEPERMMGSCVTKFSTNHRAGVTWPSPGPLVTPSLS